MFPGQKTRSLRGWQPSASFELIRLRAQTYKNIRQFFDDQGVLEVDTPTLSYSSIPDPFIESFQTRYIPLTQVMQNTHYYLHTSPEFPMKRLLSSGLGSIYQIAKVFRQGEISAHHNPEFTLLEWYRENWDHHQLMQEVDQLLTGLLKPFVDLNQTMFISYQAVFQKQLGINPHCVSKAELIACCKKQGLDGVLNEQEDKDRFLELLFSHKIQPRLGIDKADSENKPCLCFLYHYPASQASLAKLSIENEYSIAERFEIFINGIELGNGYHELNDAQEQKSRFEQNNRDRKNAGQTEIPLDEHFLDALNHLPQCAGVAVGIERLLMIMSQVKHINEVIAFPFDKA